MSVFRSSVIILIAIIVFVSYTWKSNPQHRRQLRIEKHGGEAHSHHKRHSTAVRHVIPSTDNVIGGGDHKVNPHAGSKYATHKRGIHHEVSGVKNHPVHSRSFHTPESGKHRVMPVLSMTAEQNGDNINVEYWRNPSCAKKTVVGGDGWCITSKMWSYIKTYKEELEISIDTTLFQNDCCRYLDSKPSMFLKCANAETYDAYRRSALEKKMNADPSKRTINCGMEPLHPSWSLPDVYHNQKYTSFWEFEGGLLVNSGGSDVGSKTRGKQQHIDIVADEHGHADGSVADTVAVHKYNIRAAGKQHIDIVADEHGNADGSVADTAAVHDYHLHAAEKRVGREPPPDLEEDEPEVETASATDKKEVKHNAKKSENGLVFNFLGLPIKARSILG